jgi:hypothetical protein
VYCSAHLKSDKEGNFGYFKMKLLYRKLYMVYLFKMKEKNSRATMYTESVYKIIQDFRRTVEDDVKSAILVFGTLKCNLCIATLTVCISSK